mmetsp:Transcript_10801/g.15016  ORF Transcript_10801/g.15016 Transcript_10801/m.15016 type:complete len:219 (-) Transcript_10801:207-863(-)
MASSCDRKGAKLIAVTCEFIECAIHTILCIRDVYPRAIFKAARKFDAPVRMSRHPKLSEYIADLIQGLYECMKKGIVHRVELLIIKDGKAIPELCEKYIFEVGPEINRGDMSPEIRAEFCTFLVRLMSIDMIRPRNKGIPLTFNVRMMTTSQEACAEKDWTAVGPQDDLWGNDCDNNNNDDSLLDNLNDEKAVSTKITPIHHMRKPFSFALHMVTPND